jgi:hypothetical protein
MPMYADVSNVSGLLEDYFGQDRGKSIQIVKDSPFAQ